MWYINGYLCYAISRSCLFLLTICMHYIVRCALSICLLKIYKLYEKILMLSQWKNAKRCNHICYNQDKRCYQTNDPRGGSIAIWTWLLPKCYKYFLTQVEDFNVGDFVQFTRRLIYENETLYITLINTPADNALPLSKLLQ